MAFHQDFREESEILVYVAEVPDTPIGQIWIAWSQQGLVAVEIGRLRDQFTERLKMMGFNHFRFDSQDSSAATGQIRQYLEGRRTNFDLAIDWSMITRFQRQVFEVVLAVPFGEVITYGEIAHRLGKPEAARAVGRAVATNPLPIVIPCHRVIGADGKLHGYRAPKGIETKAWLLTLEGVL